MQNWSHDTLELREKFKILLLNRANKVLGIVHIFTGGVSRTAVDPKLIFAAELKANSSGISISRIQPAL